MVLQRSKKEEEMEEDVVDLQKSEKEEERVLQRSKKEEEEELQGKAWEESDGELAEPHQDVEAVPA